MLHLITSNWGWLFGALAFGVIIGWTTWQRIRERWVDQVVLLAAALVAVGILVAVLGLVHGRAGYGLNLALSMIGIYTIGCAFGWLARDLAEAPAVAAGSWPAAAPVPANWVRPPYLSKPGQIPWAVVTAGPEAVAAWTAERARTSAGARAADAGSTSGGPGASLGARPSGGPIPPAASAGLTAATAATTASETSPVSAVAPDPSGAGPTAGPKPAASASALSDNRDDRRTAPMAGEAAAPSPASPPTKAPGSVPSAGVAASDGPAPTTQGARPSPIAAAPSARSFEPAASTMSATPAEPVGAPVAPPPTVEPVPGDLPLFSAGPDAKGGASRPARDPGVSGSGTTAPPAAAVIASPPESATSSPVPEPAPSPPVPDEDKHGGTRPAGLVTARGGTADVLTRIRGIGPQNETRLHGLGIWHFAQIAAWTPENVHWVGSYLAFPGRIDREKWVEQAAVLAAGGAGMKDNAAARPRPRR